MEQKKFTLTSNGYLATKPPYGYTGKVIHNGRFVYVHQLIMEKKIGRCLLPGESVVHRNGNRLDNSIKNLELYVNLYWILRSKRQVSREIECCGCLKKFIASPLKRQKVAYSFCSKKCYDKFNKLLNVKSGRNAQNAKCFFCGKIFHRKPSELKHHTVAYCSKDCYFKGCARLNRIKWALRRKAY